MSLSLKRPPPPPLRSPPKLFTIIEPYPSLLIVSVISFSLHFSLNSTLAGLYPNDEVLAEMEDRVKGEIWRFTVGAGRLICFVGMAVACVGVWGAVKDNLASLRIFALHSFITLFLSTLSITSLLFLSLLPADHAISQSFSSFLCTELTEGDLFAHSSTSAPHAPNNAPWFFDLDSDTLGWGIESCEERWRSTLGFGALLLLIVLAVLGHGVWVVWGYYRLASARKVWGSSTEVGGAVRLGGYNPVHRRTRSRSRSTSASGSGSSSGGGRHTKDRSRSTAMDLSLSNGDGKAPRILLLPPHTDVSSLSSTSATTGGAYTDEPASFSFKLTPASPEAKRDSFPPLPHAHSHSHSHSPLSSSTRQRSGSSPASTRQEYVVYAPIHITMQEAMALNAREAFVSSPSNSPSIQPAAAGLNYFTSPQRTTANPLSGGSGESTPKEKGRNRSDSAATVVASSSAARNQGAGQELPRYDELQAGEKRVY